MDLTYFSRLKGAQSGFQAQKYHFWVSFVNHTGSVEKTYYYTGYFTDTKIRKSWWEMVQEKQNYEKSYFCILIREQSLNI